MAREAEQLPPGPQHASERAGMLDAAREARERRAMLVPPQVGGAPAVVDDRDAARTPAGAPQPLLGMTRQLYVAATDGEALAIARRGQDVHRDGLAIGGCGPGPRRGQRS